MAEKMSVTVLLLLALALQAAPGAAAAASKSNAALMKEAREAYDRGEKAAFLAIYEELARRRPGEVFTLYNLACGPTLGVVVDGAVYFSADSQGQKFLDAKHPIGPDETRDAVILRLPLSPARPRP